ncbi:hypothetical protein ADUPG1_014098 [Aduncisulcus paluster]|uniref:Uncharacterized protein n=1 Tax=Aduncisulcus paluster TaxID=2918883 RepID=A0ABQ5KDI7_9EUKA|nr:hypothetical protein ADUPG1_014098 [Aduncisulcus paluster]
MAAYLTMRDTLNIELYENICREAELVARVLAELEFIPDDKMSVFPRDLVLHSNPDLDKINDTFVIGPFISSIPLPSMNVNPVPSLSAAVPESSREVLQQMVETPTPIVSIDSFVTKRSSSIVGDSLFPQLFIENDSNVTSRLYPSGTTTSKHCHTFDASELHRIVIDDIETKKRLEYVRGLSSSSAFISPIVIPTIPTISNISAIFVAVSPVKIASYPISVRMCIDFAKKVSHSSARICRILKRKIPAMRQYLYRNGRTDDLYSMIISHDPGSSSSYLPILSCSTPWIEYATKRRDIELQTMDERIARFKSSAMDGCVYFLLAERCLLLKSCGKWKEAEECLDEIFTYCSIHTQSHFFSLALGLSYLCKSSKGIKRWMKERRSCTLSLKSVSDIAHMVSSELISFHISLSRPDISSAFFTLTSINPLYCLRINDICSISELSELYFFVLILNGNRKMISKVYDRLSMDTQNMLIACHPHAITVSQCLWCLENRLFVPFIAFLKKILVSFLVKYPDPVVLIPLLLLATLSLVFGDMEGFDTMKTCIHGEEDDEEESDSMMHRRRDHHSHIIGQVFGIVGRELWELLCDIHTRIPLEYGVVCEIVLYCFEKYRHTLTFVNLGKYVLQLVEKEMHKIVKEEEE